MRICASKILRLLGAGALEHPLPQLVQVARRPRSTASRRRLTSLLHLVGTHRAVRDLGKVPLHDQRRRHDDAGRHADSADRLRDPLMAPRTRPPPAGRARSPPAPRRRRRARIVMELPHSAASIITPMMLLAFTAMPSLNNSISQLKVLARRTIWPPAGRGARPGSRWWPRARSRQHPAEEDEQDEREKGEADRGQRRRRTSGSPLRRWPPPRARRAHRGQPITSRYHAATSGMASTDGERGGGAYPLDGTGDPRLRDRAADLPCRHRVRCGATTRRWPPGRRCTAAGSRARPTSRAPSTTAASAAPTRSGTSPAQKSWSPSAPSGLQSAVRSRTIWAPGTPSYSARAVAPSARPARFGMAVEEFRRSHHGLRVPHRVHGLEIVQQRLGGVAHPDTQHPLVVPGPLHREEPQPARAIRRSSQRRGEKPDQRARTSSHRSRGPRPALRIAPPIAADRAQPSATRVSPNPVERSIAATGSASSPRAGEPQRGQSPGPGGIAHQRGVLQPPDRAALARGQRGRRGAGWPAHWRGAPSRDSNPPSTARTSPSAALTPRANCHGESDASAVAATVAGP